MSDAAAPPLVEDRFIDGPLGRLFLRQWTPVAASAAVQPALVLLHDSLGSVELWREFPSQLAHATGRLVVAYDRAGYGRSGARTGLPAHDFVGREVAEGIMPVLDALGLERAVLVGHSVGGGMAVNAAAKAPARVQAVITIAAQAFPEDLTLKAIAEAKVQFQDAAQLGRLARYHGDKARWVVDAWTDSWLSPAFAAWHLREVLPGVSCPLLALHGEHDEYGTAVHPQILSSRCAGPAHSVLLKDAHHLPHREQPEVVIALMQDFLDRYDDGATA